MTRLMKNFRMLFLFVCMGFFAVSVASAAEEGVDYVVLSNPIADAQNTLIKVWSYDCPFCYKYDKAITQPVVEKLPKGTVFSVWHLKTKGKYGPQANELFAVLKAKDEKAGLSIFDPNAQFKKAKFAYYAAYHDKKERWDAGQAAFLKTGMDAAGITQAEFDAMKNDPRVIELLAKWDNALEIAKVQGIPAYIVNGKYLIYTKSIKSIDGMANLIKELLNK